MNLQHFDRALYERASRRKSKGFDREFYDHCLEERRAGGHSSSAAAVSASGASAYTGTPATLFTTAAPYVWHRADVLTNSAGVCTQLNDQSGGARHMGVFTTGPNIVTADATFGNKQTLTMGASTGLFVNSVSITPPFMLWAFVNLTTWQSTNVVVGNSGGKGLVTSFSSPNFAMNNGTAANPSPGTIGTWQLVICEFTGSTSDRIKVGSSAFTTTPGTNAGSGSITLYGINLAGGPGLGTFKFRECGVVPAIPTGTEYTNLRRYALAQFASIDC